MQRAWCSLVQVDETNPLVRPHLWRERASMSPLPEALSLFSEGQ
jgi:hypothetical protein